MGDFRRQPSKVWWSSFPEDADSRLGGSSAAAEDASSESAGNEKRGMAEEGRQEEEDELVPGTAEKFEWEDEGKSPDVSSDRGCSSSPSQGSHKSQDSGFSDSEIHSNAIPHSPRDSPDLSKRVEWSGRGRRRRDEDDDDDDEESTGAGPGSCLARRFRGVARAGVPTPRKNYLETAFDGSSTEVRESRSLFARMNRVRTKGSDKMNKLQNQLELSFKRPTRKPTTTTTTSSPPKAVASNPRTGGSSTRSESELDSEGFKIPKSLAEQNVDCRASDNFLNLTHIEGPPVSCSTPKAANLRRQESPTPRAARATEKRIGSMSTFATIRKLKGISEKKMKRPINLFPGFNRSKSIKAEGGGERKGKAAGESHSSIQQWLSELGTMYEAEIMTMLQSKSLATDLTRQVTSMAATTSDTVRKLHRKTRTISSEFSRLFQYKKNKNYKQIAPVVQSLVSHIKEFLKDYVENSEVIPRSDADSANQRFEAAEEVREMVTDFRQEEPKTKEIAAGPGSLVADVARACEDLAAAADEDAVEGNLAALGKKFTELVDLILLTHIKALVRTLEEPKTELALRTALSALSSLDLEGSLLGVLVARCEGVRALLAVCLEARATAVRVMALRALTIVCYVTETIAQFEKAGGLEIISDLLADESRCEAEVSEAVGVLAQITAPWIKDNHSLRSLSRFLGALVKSLTRIVKECKSSETLLLSSAALANLTFMEPRTVWPLVEHQTAKVLLSAVRRQGLKASVFVQEQAATVIANMASVPECRKHLAENRAVVALLCFLQIRHSPFQREPEIAAAERVQQKSAIALSRLCSDSVVAGQVVELQGVTRLVRLCKEERERNHSDGVLVACLAALRKIVANCGTETLEKLEAMELVEQRLLDSFLLYSSKQESYV